MNGVDLPHSNPHGEKAPFPHDFMSVFRARTCFVSAACFALISSLCAICIVRLNLVEAALFDAPLSCLNRGFFLNFAGP